MKRKLLTSFASAGAMTALAAQNILAAQEDITGGLATYDLDKLIGFVINAAVIIAGLIVLIYLIWAGIKYITSAGDAGKTEEAQKQIVAAIIGLAIIILAYTILRVVFSVLGFDANLSLESLLSPDIKK